MKRFIIIFLIVLLIFTQLFSLIGCKGNNDTELQFVLPDGTPALSVAQLLGKRIQMQDYYVNTHIVSTTELQTQIGGEKADIIVAPTNLGASLINKGADYKCVAVLVEGSLFLVGKPISANRTTIDIEDLKNKSVVSIGKGNTPDKVFRYIIENTNGVNYDNNNSKLIFSDGAETKIEFTADGAGAVVALSRENNPCDFAIVGEPMATILGQSAKGGYSARMDLQELYKEISGDDNYPQASLFVKTYLCNNQNFLEELFVEIENSQEWVFQNTNEIKSVLSTGGSTTTFPLPSIEKCAITLKKANNENVQRMIKDYLKLMIPNIDWEAVSLFV